MLDNERKVRVEAFLDSIKRDDVAVGGARSIYNRSKARVLHALILDFDIDHTEMRAE